MSLRRYSTEELEAELQKRKSGQFPGSDYYYFVDDSDHDINEGEPIPYAFVEKSFWHEHGCIDENCEVDLPESFQNIKESVWEFTGAHEEAEKILNDLGFTKLLDI